MAVSASETGNMGNTFTARVNQFDTNTFKYTKAVGLFGLGFTDFCEFLDDPVIWANKNNALNGCIVYAWDTENRCQYPTGAVPSGSIAITSRHSSVVTDSEALIATQASHIAFYVPPLPDYLCGIVDMQNNLVNPIGKTAARAMLLRYDGMDYTTFHPVMVALKAFEDEQGLLVGPLLNTLNDLHAVSQFVFNNMQTHQGFIAMYNAYEAHVRGGGQDDLGNAVPAFNPENFIRAAVEVAKSFQGLRDRGKYICEENMELLAQGLPMQDPDAAINLVKDVALANTGGNRARVWAFAYVYGYSSFLFYAYGSPQMKEVRKEFRVSPYFNIDLQVDLEDKVRQGMVNTSISVPICIAHNARRAMKTSFVFCGIVVQEVAATADGKRDSLVVSGDLAGRIVPASINGFPSVVNFFQEQDGGKIIWDFPTGKECMKIEERRKKRTSQFSSYHAVMYPIGFRHMSSPLADELCCLNDEYYTRYFGRITQQFDPNDDSVMVQVC